PRGPFRPRARPLLLRELRRPDAGRAARGRRMSEASTPCVVCGATETKKLFEKGGRDFVRCTECGLVRLDPLPSVEEIAAYYAAAYDGGFYSSFVEADD